MVEIDDEALRLIRSRRERAAQVAAATHVFGDPKGLDDDAVERELASGRGRRERRHVLDEMATAGEQAGLYEATATPRRTR